MLEFEWDKGNIDKISRRFKISEIESFFNQELLLFIDLKHTGNELRFFGIGMSSQNKPMFVCFTFREGLIRIISARRMRKKEHDKYEKAKESYK